MTKIVVIGGTGFVGQHLAARLGQTPGVESVFIAHRRRPKWAEASKVMFVDCSLGDIAGLQGVFENADAVVNLLRPDGSGERLRDLEALVPILTRLNPARLIHASSIDVYDNYDGMEVTESCPARPNSDYAREHVAMEQVYGPIPGLIVLRLAAVFGEGGVNINSLAKDACTGGFVRRAIRRSLLGNRRMHLISVASVVGCIAHLALSEQTDVPPLLLVAEDDDERNHFGFVQDTVLAEFGYRTLSGVPHLPLKLAEDLLRWSGRPYREVGRLYLTEFPNIVAGQRADFGAAVAAYARQLRSGCVL